MGNCQAAEAAAVVIQHPGGKVERLYGAATAAEVMRSNPGHYVALVVLRVSGPGSGGGCGGAKPDPAVAAAGAKVTKVKLLKPKDTLLLGQVYRLITSQGTAPLQERFLDTAVSPVSPRFDLDSSEESEPTDLIRSFPFPTASRARRGGAGDPGAAAGEDAAVRGGGRRPAAATGRRRLRSRAGAVRRQGTEATAAPERRRERAALAAVAAEHLRVGELTRRDATTGLRL